MLKILFDQRCNSSGLAKEDDPMSAPKDQNPADLKPPKIAKQGLELSAAFTLLLRQFCTWAGEEGFELIPSRSGNLHFAALSEPRQIQVFDAFSEYVAIAEEVRKHGWHLRDDQKFLWAMIKKLGLRPSAGLFDQLTDDDFIEIIDLSGIQLFRNLRYFTVCSYTLDDLLCRPWYELFSRDLSVSDSLNRTIGQMLGSGLAGVYPYDAGVHHLDEIDSVLRFRCQIENRFISPLFDSSQKVAAAVNVTRLVSCVARAGASNHSPKK